MSNHEVMVYNGFHKITEIESVIKNKKVKREKLIAKSAVVGIVIDENNRIGLVSQYRPIINKITKEIPAGLLDKEGLTDIEVLLEELEEECGIVEDDILQVFDKPIHEYFMMAGSSDAKISFYEIHVKEQRDKEVDDVDVISVEWVDMKQYHEYIQSGAISDGKTILAYYYLLTRNMRFN